MSEPTWQQMVNTSLTKVEMRVDQLAKRIEQLQERIGAVDEGTTEHCDDIDMRSVERSNHTIKRLDLLEKKFMDTWMQNLPVKTYAMLDRLDKLEKDRLVDVIGRIENLENVFPIAQKYILKEIKLLQDRLDAMPSKDATSATPSIDVEKAERISKDTILIKCPHCRGQGKLMVYHQEGYE